MPISRFVRVLSLLLIGVACSDVTQVRAPDAIEIVSGNDQPAIAGTTLADPLVVRVVDASDRPVSGVAVTWSVQSGGGSVSPTSSTTNANGLAQTEWTLGSATGEQRVRASAASVTPVEFTVNAESPFSSVGCWGSPIVLTAGQSVTFSGAAASEMCVTAGIGGGEFLAIPQNVSTNLDDTLTIQALGTIGGPVVSLGDTDALRLSIGGRGTTLVPGLERERVRRDEDFHSRLRASERGLARRIPGARAAFRDRMTRASGGPSLAIGSTNPQVGDMVTINANATVACSSPINRQGRVAAVTQHAVIVHDVGNPANGFTDADYLRLGTTFDTLIHPLAVRNFGAPQDIDGNGRAYIFYTAEVNKLTERGSGSYVGGFYWVRDLFPRTRNADFEGCATSNEGELFYMLVPDPNGTVSDARSKDFVERVTLGTIAHEYQHLINASRRMFVNDAFNFEERWMDEGLAHVAEELTFYESADLVPRQNLGLDELRASQKTLDAFNLFGLSNFFRLEDFVLDPSHSSPSDPKDALATRGATWHFLRYAADRRGGDEATFWLSLVNSRVTGMANLSAVIGSPEAYFRGWADAVLLDDLFTGPADKTVASWNTREIFTAQGTGGPLFTGGTYSLDIDPLSTSAPTSRQLIPESPAYLSLTLGSGGSGAFQFRSGGAAPPAQISVTLVRTR